MAREINPDSDKDESPVKGCLTILLTVILLLLGCWKLIELIILAFHHIRG
jgi:uncharacterized membrane protein